MAPREANNPFPDQYLTVEYDATVGPIAMPHDPDQGNNDDGGQVDMDLDDVDPPTPPVNLEELEEESMQEDNNNAPNATTTQDDDVSAPAPPPPTEVQIAAPNTLTVNTEAGNHGAARRRHRLQPGTAGVSRNNTNHHRPAPGQLFNRFSQLDRPLNSIGSDSHLDVDPLAIDMTDPEEEEAWNIANAMLVDSALASNANPNCVVTTENHSSIRPQTPPNSRNTSVSERGSSDHALRRHSDYHNNSNINTTPTGSRNASGPFAVSPSPGASGPSSRNASHLRHMFRHRTRSLSSVLDQDPSMDSGSEAEDENVMEGVPELDTTQETASTEYVTAPNTPNHESVEEILTYPSGEVLPTASSATTAANNLTEDNSTEVALSPVRSIRPSQPVVIVTDEDEDSGSSSSISQNGSSSPLQGSTGSAHDLQNGLPVPLLTAPPSPHRLRSISNSTGASFVSINSGRSIQWTPAFDSANQDDGSATESYLNSTSSSHEPSHSSHSHPGPNHINLAFGPNTSVSDLKYFAERGCIVPLLRALKTARLKTLGTRMLADYAKMPDRRVAVASNKRILEFCCRTMLEIPSGDNMGTEWPAREYAVETIRSLTATEDSDGYLMGCNGLLKALAVVARGGPFAVEANNDSDSAESSPPDSPFNLRRGVPTRIRTSSSNSSGSFHSAMGYEFKTTVNKGLVSGKARLHACIAIMNLSCGKANKIEIASISEILEAMRDVMMAPSTHFSPATSSPPLPNGHNGTTTPQSVAEEAHLKAATCIKNLSNADLNDAALLGSPGLVEALGYIASESCTVEQGATNCTTNACLALMNLSISKANKHKVFKTKGVMDALMIVITRTSPGPPTTGRRQNCNKEARVKACSALSNLAIGYENKIPMFAYPGFVDSILQVIDTDFGEARTKACSILWSFAAEMKNQVPVVQRGDILPTLVRVAEEDNSTEARFKCVAALTLLAESLDNALPLLESGALHPIMDILHEAGADPTQWRGQTASWCVGFLMNMAQSDDAVPFLREAGVVELLAPLLTLDHYQSLKAAMAVTFVCRYDEDDETYDLLRKTENVIPKIISLLHNTLSGRGGNGYKYGVFTLRSSVGCISSLASGPDFMKERIATGPVFESLLRVVTDFCVNGGTKGAIVGGGRDDALSATLAVRALQNLTQYYIPIASSSGLPFGLDMDQKLMTALESFETCNHPDVKDETRALATDANERIQQSQGLSAEGDNSNDSSSLDDHSSGRTRNNIIENSIVASLVQGCCIGPSLHTGDDDGFFLSLSGNSSSQQASQNPSRGTEPTVECVSGDESIASSSSRSYESRTVRTFLLTDSRTGRRFAVPTELSGGRAFNDGRRWCYRRGRFCRAGENPDPNFRWTEEMQNSYATALAQQRAQRSSSASQSS